MFQVYNRLNNYLFGFIMYRQFANHNNILIFISFLFSAFIIGIASALQSPTLSRFLTYEVAANPIQVGVFYSINAIACIVGSFLLAKYSDSHGQRRYIVLFCCLMGIGNSVVFALTRNYYLLITVGVFFAALASAAMPQIFALAREYAEKTKRNVVVFNSLIRAQLSLAWVIGPPLSFALAISYGFNLLYYSIIGMYLIAMIIVNFCLPAIPRTPKTLTSIESSTNPIEQSLFKNHNIIFLFLATVFMWTANMMYIIDMPLYVDQVLQLADTLPGKLMGIAAGLEIPVMLASGYLVPKFGKRNLILFAIICGLFFYLGVITFSNQWALIGLQIFNALFIGIVANIGIIYFQDLLPNRMGVATTLFNNGVTCGVILSGMIQGFVTDFYSHQVIYYIATVMMGLSLLLCVQVRNTK